ncbi:MAG: hypothetical protein GX444_11915, partial [Myxococcales bacterium]|nr:hypothetical protein [Myxococcales bacterium]
MKKALLFGMIFLCLSLLAVMSCNDKSTSDDDDDADSGQDDDNDDNDTLPSGCDDDTAYDPTLCADNVPPVPLSAEVEVNGQIVETPVTVHWDDEMMIYLEYEDENCNLGEGEAFLLYSDSMMFWQEGQFILTPFEGETPDRVMLGRVAVATDGGRRPTGAATATAAPPGGIDVQG